jgi:tRNA (guanine37-N1)-methyltransferase
LLAGRYEGVDERVLDAEIEDQISIGDYVLSGGELPAMVLMDALIRRIPGTLNDAESAKEESFMHGLLDFPQYTRPEIYESDAVPSVLLSGHHAQITRWRMKQSLGRTWRKRPDLLANLHLSAEQVALLEEYKSESMEAQEVIK